MNATTRSACIGLATLGLLTVGCSGGSSSDAPVVVPPGTTAPPAIRSNLVITVSDQLGAPVSNARVRVVTHLGEFRTVTYPNGVTEATDVIGPSATIIAETADQYGSSTFPLTGGQAAVNANVEVQPKAPATGGITRAHVVAGGVRDEGRTLEFRLGLLQVANPVDGEFWPDEHWAEGSYNLHVADCVPDTANDGSRFRPDCVAGTEGFDASYAVLNGGKALTIGKSVVCCYDPLSAPALSSTLLLDQSGAVASSDPGDHRLYAAKYFLTRGSRDRRLGLAAFAAHDAATGQPALLPQQPLTIFPLENPVIGAAGRELFPTVDALGSLEGGGAPLYDALDRLIDYAAPGPEQISTIVVVTDGRDTTCGNYSQCKARRDQVLQKSRDRKVSITTVGLSADPAGADYEALGALSQGSYERDRAAFWASDPRQLPAILRTALLNQQWPERRLEATFQIQAPTAGTFAPGRTVIGTVRLEYCPWDCFQIAVPFTVQIP
jgi:hypothetical protein